MVTDSSKGIIVAKDNYLKSIKTTIKEEELIKKDIKIDSITSAIINGYTNYYIVSDKQKYKVSISVSDNLPFIKSGDTITIGINNIETEIIEIEKIY